MKLDLVHVNGFRDVPECHQSDMGDNLSRIPRRQRHGRCGEELSARCLCRDSSSKVHCGAEEVVAFLNRLPMVHAAPDERHGGVSDSGIEYSAQCRYSTHRIRERDHDRVADRFDEDVVGTERALGQAAESPESGDRLVVAVRLCQGGEAREIDERECALRHVVEPIVASSK